MTVRIDSALNSDTKLLTRVRGGDSDAYGELYRRHVAAARRLATVLARDAGEAEDLAAEAFARVLATLRAGGGPQAAFRPYLLTAVRNAFSDRVRRTQRVEPTDAIEEYERPEPYEDPSIAALERSYAARAFARLPERWRAVLWHTEVEGESPKQIAPLFGLTANAVAALAFRARERLRQGYLAEHITLTGSPRCHWTGEHLPSYVRAGLAGRERTKVEDHLAECAECRRLHRELTEANVSLRAVLAPPVLGAAAPDYLAMAAGKTGLAALWAAIGAALAGRRHAATRAVAGAWAYLGRAAADAGRWLTALPQCLVRRYGGPTVAAAAGVAVAAALGLAVLVVSVMANPAGTPPSRDTTAADLPVPVPAVPSMLTAAPQPPWLTSSAPLPSLSQIRPGSTPTHSRTRPAVATPEGGSTPEAGSTPEPVPVAPEGMRIAYADAGRLRTAIAGSSLLSCLPRPACLDQDDNTLTMSPLLPTPAEPGPPSGLFAPGGPTIPGGHLTELAGAKATSGARVDLPRGAKVRWAGLVVAGSDAGAPSLVALHGQGGGWYPVRLTRPVTVSAATGGGQRPVAQGYADVTSLLRAAGGGFWWVAAAAGELPSGRGAYAGWSVAVVYELPAAPIAQVAVHIGPAMLDKPDARVTIRVAARTRVEVALALWDGDRTLGGDSLHLGGGPAGDPTNLAQGASPSAAELVCASGSAGCEWRTPGVDVLRFEGETDWVGAITLRAGGDPLCLGLIAFGEQIAR